MLHLVHMGGVYSNVGIHAQVHENYFLIQPLQVSIKKYETALDIVEWCFLFHGTQYEWVRSSVYFVLWPLSSLSINCVDLYHCK